MPSFELAKNSNKTERMETTEKRETFSEIINSGKTVLVDFFAEWCGPCKMMQPILKELNTMTGDDVRIIKIDVDKNPMASNTFQVRGVPRLIIFKNGQIQWRQSGVLSAVQLKKVIAGIE